MTENKTTINKVLVERDILDTVEDRLLRNIMLKVPSKHYRAVQSAFMNLDTALNNYHKHLSK